MRQRPRPPAEESLHREALFMALTGTGVARDAPCPADMPHAGTNAPWAPIRECFGVHEPDPTQTIAGQANSPLAHWVVDLQSGHVLHIKLVTLNAVNGIPNKEPRLEAWWHADDTQETALGIEDVPIRSSEILDEVVERDLLVRQVPRRLNSLDPDRAQVALMDC